MWWLGIDNDPLSFHFTQVPKLKKKTTTTAAKKKITKTELTFDHVHDWGPFGEYQYLGAGTPFSRKSAAGVNPKNWLDTMAYGHDYYYEKSSGGTPGLQRTITRGGADLIFGLGMIGSGFSPWSDLSLGDRALALGSGAALFTQGALRAHPVTALPMALYDWIAY